MEELDPRVDEQRLAELRDANEHLVVAAVRAQRLTEEAENATQLKDDFLAMVSHELRTPLNAIVGWIRLLETGQLASVRADDAIAAIGHNASALAHIIDDLLDTSRFLKGSIRLEPQIVDLLAVVQAALDAVGPMAASKNVELAFEAASARRTVVGDAFRLEQIFSNLLSNALKFTPAGGRVQVVVESSDGCMEVRVVDTGRGISPEFLPHVFEPFRQGEDATTQRQTGLGLGLGIVRKLVELHSGTVHAASDGEGRGATFTVRLPMAAAEARVDPSTRASRTAAPSTTTPPSQPRLLDGLHILIVDDSAEGRALTSMVLRLEGASVTAVGSVREALDALEVEWPDALVSDIDLPGEDGYALIRQVRQHEAGDGARLPAVALTGYARADDRDKILAAGFQVHVAKPVEPDALTAVIMAITARRGRDEAEPEIAHTARAN